MKFTKIPENTFEELQMNAGILVENFDPKTGEITNLLGATTGGITFKDSVEYRDNGEDIDNCPKNMLELKELDKHEATLEGTFVTVTAASGKKLAGAADIDPEDETHIVPRNDLALTDFEDIWWVGDYSKLNGEKNGGFCAIHLMNALNTGGFQISATDKAKGQFAFSFLGHYTIEEQDTVPYEIYIKAGEEETASRSRQAES